MRKHSLGPSRDAAYRQGSRHPHLTGGADGIQPVDPPMSARAKLKDGLWYCIEYRDGERHLESFGRGVRAEKLAQEAADAINAQRVLERQGKLRTSSGMRLATYAEEWQRTIIEPHRATGTIRNYRQLLDDHLLPELGALALSDIKPHVIKTFIAKKLKEQRTRKRKDGQAAGPVAAGAPRARNTVRNMVAVLRALLNHAVEFDNLLDSNPAAKFGKRFFGGASQDEGIHVETYEEAEVAQILTTARKLYPDFEVYLRTLFFTGLRLGELLGLQWSDFDFRRGLLAVRRKVKVQRGQLLVEETKTHRVRLVDVADDLLARWQDLQSLREAEATLASRAPSRWCCPSIKSAARPLNASWFNHKVWARILRAADLRRLRVHDTRHTYAALMLRQGKSIEYVSQQLGHSKIDITIRFYAHFKPGVNRHNANDFEKRIRAFEVAD